MPQVSSIWIPGRRWAPALGHPTVRNPAGGRRRIPLPGAPILYSGITLSDERGEAERAHCRRSVRPMADAIPDPEERRTDGSACSRQRPIVPNLEPFVNSARILTSWRHAGVSIYVPSTPSTCALLMR
jgi:hypothetical protein